MFVDPLAEKYPGWTPYHYVHNNPVNMVDPTGMEGEGWIESYTDDGQAMLTYDADVNTKEQAITKGYKNVSTVSESLYYEGRNNTESYNLNKDGTVYNNTTESVMDVGFSPIRTGDGTYIQENNGIKSLSAGLQTGGDLVTYFGLAGSITGVGAPVGGVLTGAGGIMNLAGTAIESAYLFMQGKGTESVTKFGVSLFFTYTGAKGVNLSRKAAGEEAVEQGLNHSTETIINGTNTILEKNIGKDSEKKLNEYFK